MVCENPLVPSFNKSVVRTVLVVAVVAAAVHVLCE